MLTETQKLYCTPDKTAVETAPLQTMSAGRRLKKIA